MSNSCEWTHQRGDRYVPLCWYPQGTPGEWHSEVEWAGAWHPSAPSAFREGIRSLGHDDFNIAVIRGGSVAAMLWGNEHIEYETNELAQVGQGLSGWIAL